MMLFYCCRDSVSLEVWSWESWPKDEEVFEDKSVPE